jgi:hypothetical protein
LKNHSKKEDVSCTNNTLLTKEHLPSNREIDSVETVNTRMRMKSKRRAFDAAARALQSGRGKRQNAGTSEAQADRGQKLRRSSSSEQRITAQGWGPGAKEK